MEKLSEVKQALKYLEIDAKAYADNFSASMIVSTKNILAIAEAFRALDQEVQKNLDGALAWQQRAEAAEAERSALQDGFAEAIRHKDRLADELNELAKQEPAGHFMLARDEDDSWWHEASEQNDKAIPLYTRPAPAADLSDLVAELVPPEADGSNLPFAANGWNACRAAILRNIEEAK